MIDCPKIKDMWIHILDIYNRIDPSMIGLTQNNILLGIFEPSIKRDLLRYLISVGKFSAWKERVSYQFKKDEKLNCLLYFKNYIRMRLRIEQTMMDLDSFKSK